jgi:hypothetical protein
VGAGLFTLHISNRVTPAGGGDVVSEDHTIAAMHVQEGYAATGVIEWTDGNDPTAVFKKYVKLTSVPAVGHVVEVEGKDYRVSQVRHIVPSPDQKGPPVLAVAAIVVRLEVDTANTASPVRVKVLRPTEKGSEDLGWYSFDVAPRLDEAFQWQFQEGGPFERVVVKRVLHFMYAVEDAKEKIVSYCILVDRVQQASAAA